MTVGVGSRHSHAPSLQRWGVSGSRLPTTVSPIQGGRIRIRPRSSCLLSLIRPTSKYRGTRVRFVPTRLASAWGCVPTPPARPSHRRLRRRRACRRHVAGWRVPGSPWRAADRRRRLIFGAPKGCPRRSRPSRGSACRRTPTRHSRGSTSRPRASRPSPIPPRAARASRAPGSHVGSVLLAARRSHRSSERIMFSDSRAHVTASGAARAVRRLPGRLRLREDGSCEVVPRVARR
jgi:hypothetical protein